MVFRDALYGDIEITNDLIIELITTPEFQRLRKIKQLGLTYLIFPTAEHSRYSHSLGVYHLSKQIVDIVSSKRGMKFDKIEVLAFSISCLLHDIGHGPFSHTTEEVFHLNHEKYSIDIVCDKNTNINKILNNYNKELVDQIAAFINKTHENKVLVSAMSSTIDIDRMDYLMRDSHFAGVVYGKFDVTRILKLIDVHDEKIVFLEKGIRTLEDFILSRYHMFCQVYLNTKSIGYETLAKNILDYTRELYLSGYRFKTNISKLIPYLDGNTLVSDYLLLNDYSLLTILEDFSRIEKDQKLVSLSKSFVLQKPFDHEKIDGYEYYEFESLGYKKILYNETVYIKMETGEIKALEEVSPLIKFAKKSLKIETLDRIYLVRKI